MIPKFSCIKFPEIVNNFPWKIPEYVLLILLIN